MALRLGELVRWNEDFDSLDENSPNSCGSPAVRIATLISLIHVIVK